MDNNRKSTFWIKNLLLFLRLYLYKMENLLFNRIAYNIQILDIIKNTIRTIDTIWLYLIYIILHHDIY